MILRGIKTRVHDDLKAQGKNWLKELPTVLWATRTNPNRATRETPFYFVYGAEAVLPPEVALGAYRVAHFDENDQEEARGVDFMALEEGRVEAAERIKKYQETLRRHYQKKVCQRSLEVGDLVLKKDRRAHLHHKLSSPWEGPFIVVDVAAPGAYVLAEVNGAVLKSTWNIDQLRKFYV